MCRGIPTAERRRERTEKDDGRLCEKKMMVNGMGRHSGGQISRYELGIFCIALLQPRDQPVCSLCVSALF